LAGTPLGSHEGDQGPHDKECDVPATALSRVGARVVGSDTTDEYLNCDTWARLEALPDPRSPQGLIYPLPCLVAVAVCAMTATGHDGLTGVGQWVKNAAPQDLARLRCPWDPFAGAYRVPDEKTIRVGAESPGPARVDPGPAGPAPTRAHPPDGRPSRSVRDYRARRLAAQAKALARSRLRAVAVDGKTSRGARRRDGTRVHLLGVVEHGGRLLDHVEVDVKHNETSHFTDLLLGLDLTDLAVTFDALHTVRANLDWLVTTKKAAYIAVVKKNQPLLYAKVKALPWKQVQTGATTRETGHGRIETRSLKAVHVDRLGVDFPHIRQAVKLTRWRQDARTGKVSRETVYVITSLTSAQASPADLARLIREHWSVEVHHHVRDLSFREDQATSRTGHGPVNLATIRAAIIAAITDVGYLYVPEGRRDHVAAADALYLHGLA
jgi:predicted transposase YbfD/YdcC